MKSQIETNQETPSFNQNRLKEIAKILLKGIIRVEVKERSNNQLILLDNKPLRSVHSIDSNFNQ
jgi:hypothetical protein